MTPARQLPSRMVAKVWGREHLPAPFSAPEGETIGEIWFEPPPELPQVLVKYLFTSDKLSVQVHPSDAEAKPGEAGKEECWLVLDAEPGARLAIGFEREASSDDIAAAAADGTIERLLTWHPAQAGDLFYLPAGTVHAIGPGLSLLEVQQNSDTTFRLYDYGRPRELHLERGLAVARGVPYAKEHRGSVAQRGQVLFDGPHFRLERVEGAPDAATLTAYPGALLVLPLAGEVMSRDSAARA
ncbi:class I mannose-6-phosphate isomerase, partial [Porphyrobacter sp. AAP60]|uniref:class I mannose-6-phosphate isomerase n=1 Tax=Porphyrobacter sp. AAP60 TaxID=1523423 RepID=UPI0006CC4A34